MAKRMKPVAVAAIATFIPERATIIKSELFELGYSSVTLRRQRIRRRGSRMFKRLYVVHGTLYG